MKLIRISYLIFCLFVVALLSSCEYHNDETYYRNVDKNVPLPDLTVDLNFNSDTIYVYNYSTFRLSFTLTNKKLYAVKFFVNGIENKLDVIYGTNNNYSLPIDMTNRPVVRVRAEIYTSTETGSIADKIQAESYIFKSKEWILIYVPEKPVLTSAVVDGRLKLSWPNIKGFKGGKYYIKTSSYSDSTTNNWFIDSTYIGGKNYISITYQDRGASGYAIYTDVNYPYPKVYLNNKEKFEVTWEKCKFFNNMKGYRLRFENDTIELGPSDTSFIYKNGTFGSIEFVQMDLLKRSYVRNNPEYVYFDYLSGYYPSSFIPGGDYIGIAGFPLSGTDLYYVVPQNNVRVLNRFSLESRSITASSSFWFELFSVSPNNNYLLYSVGANLTLMSTDFKVYKTLPISQISGNTGIMSLTVSDAGITLDYDYTKKSMVVYDIPNEKIIAEIPEAIDDYKSEISANGDYVFEPMINALYKIGNNVATKIWSNESSSNQFKFVEFYPDNSGQIALYDGSLFYIKKCSDFSTVKTFSVDNTSIINIDFQKKKILTYKDAMLYVYSLSDGELLHRIKFYGARSNIRLINDYIISGLYQLNLNNLK